MFRYSSDFQSIRENCREQKCLQFIRDSLLFYCQSTNLVLFVCLQTGCLQVIKWNSSRRQSVQTFHSLKEPEHFNQVGYGFCLPVLQGVQPVYLDTPKTLFRFAVTNITEKIYRESLRLWVPLAKEGGFVSRGSYLHTFPKVPGVSNFK